MAVTRSKLLDVVCVNNPVHKLEACLLQQVDVATRDKLVPLTACVWYKDLARYGMSNPTLDRHVRPACVLWGCNVGSYFRHGSALLDLASKRKVLWVVMQETNLGKQSITSVAHSCSQRGWQLQAVPKRSLRSKGGVAP